MKGMKYRFDSPDHAKADEDLDKIEPWFKHFCRRKRLRFEKNYHNSPARDGLSVSRDGITKKLKLRALFSEDGQFNGYLLSTMAWRDKPRRTRESWWSHFRTMDRLPDSENALTSLLEDAWKEVKKVKAEDLKPGPEVQ